MQHYRYCTAAQKCRVASAERPCLDRYRSGALQDYIRMHQLFLFRVLSFSSFEVAHRGMIIENCTVNARYNRTFEWVESRSPIPFMRGKCSMSPIPHHLLPTTHCMCLSSGLWDGFQTSEFPCPRLCFHYATENIRQTGFPSL